MPDNFSVTERTRVIREPQRGVFDRDAIYKILDEGFICQVGFVVDGQPFVIPTDVWPGWGRHLYSWVGGQPDVAECGSGISGLRDGDAAGWVGAGAVDF